MLDCLVFTWLVDAGETNCCSELYLNLSKASGLSTTRRNIWLEPKCHLHWLVPVKSGLVMDVIPGMDQRGIAPYLRSAFAGDVLRR